MLNGVRKVPKGPRPRKNHIYIISFSNKWKKTILMFHG